jgi:hypothetical protein
MLHTHLMSREISVPNVSVAGSNPVFRSTVMSRDIGSSKSGGVAPVTTIRSSATKVIQA